MKKCSKSAQPGLASPYRKKNAKSKGRDHYWEIDFIRGVTVLVMIGFHTAFIIQFVFGKNLSSDPLFWFFSPIPIGLSFITLAGLSLYIGYSRG